MPSPPRVDSILVADVGNTRTSLGIWDADGLHDVTRFSSHNPDDWGPAISGAWKLLRERHGDAGSAVAVASVRPRLDAEFLERLEEITDHQVMRVRDDLALPMPINVDVPEQVGVDRVCMAAAAFDRVREPCAIASFGTAITIDCVSEAGVFLGGVIMPGLRIACAALEEHTAQLPLIEPRPPQSAIGRNTEDAINAGVVYGAVGALREVVERFATELGRWPTLIATGGDAPIVRGPADFIDVIVPDLCLMGVALTYRMAAERA